MSLLLIALYAVLVGLNALDGISTWKVMRPDHLSREHNPLARWIFKQLGILRGIIVVEILWIACISAVFFLLWKNPALNLALLALLCVGILAFTFVVSSNFRVYGRLRRKQAAASARNKTGQA